MCIKYYVELIRRSSWFFGRVAEYDYVNYSFGISRLINKQIRMREITKKVRYKLENRMLFSREINDVEFRIVQCYSEVSTAN